MNNKYAIGTVIGTALLGLAKSEISRKNDGVTVISIDELRRYTNDPKLAPLVTKVNLNENQLTTLPPEIGKLKNLEKLNLRSNKITTLPKEIGNLKNLKLLWLENNQLTTLPPEIGNLKKLTWLGLSYNQLTTLPTTIWKLTNLEDLDLEYNPDFYMNLEQLRQLIINGANKKILKVISYANVIPKITLNDGIYVRSVEEILRYANDYSLAPSVTKVSLYDDNITTLPPEIGNLKNLKGLSLSGANFTTLPPEIGNLTNLEQLALSRTQLTTLPPEIGKLKNLESLYLNGNQLTNLPPEIGKLKNLETLDLSNNPDLKITLNFVVDLLNTYQNTDVAEVLSKYIHQQTIPARQAIRMR